MKQLLHCAAFAAVLLLAGLIHSSFLPDIRDPGNPLKIERTNPCFLQGKDLYLDELRRTCDPSTGRIPEGIYEKEMQQAKQAPVKDGLNKTNSGNSFSFAGPSNLGGRTRAICFDVRGNHDTILAGGVSSGVYRTTDGGQSWIKVSPDNMMYNVTSIAQDPRNGYEDTWYYSTGEALGNSADAVGAPYIGNGIYKSDDNGLTWSRLANSNTGSDQSFDNRNDYISKLIVDPVTGNIYAAALGQIIRSVNGGFSWDVVLGSNGLFSTSDLTDVACDNLGNIYAALAGSVGSGSDDGVWSSSSGDSASWTRIMFDGNTSGWKSNGDYGRVVIAVAPSDPSVLYALYDNYHTSSCAGTPMPEADFFMYNTLSATAYNRSSNMPDESGCLDGNDPFAVMNGYDLAIAVSPVSSSDVVIGGTNLYLSTNGFSNYISYSRIGGYANTSSYDYYSNSHPGMHTVVFKPGTDTVWVGNDGGMQKACSSSSPVAWTEMNTNYRTLQYNSVAIDPTYMSARYVGAATNNGITYNDNSINNEMSVIKYGEGTVAAISASNTYHYFATQYGNIYRQTSAGGLGTGTNISPYTGGQAMTYFHLDPDNTSNLYYGVNGTLYRTTCASTATSVSGWTELTGVGSQVYVSPGVGDITAMATTRGTYQSGSASLFMGVYQGNFGNPKILRLDDPAGCSASANPVDITPASLNWPMGGYISGISVNSRNDDTMLVVISNYGVSSVWWTGNANSSSPSWQEAEGNVSILSIRSCIIVTRTSGVEYYIGTHAGLYTTTTINSTSTIWSREGANGYIGFAIVSALAYRPSDNNILIGTHGNGIWLMFVPNPLPVEYYYFTAKAEKMDAVLEWASPSSTNVSGFDIERSADGKSWTTLGNRAWENNTGKEGYFRFTDKQALSSTSDQYIYYRLVKKQRSGQKINSEIRQLPGAVGITRKVLSVFPMPADAFLNTNISLAPGTSMEYSIYGLNGKKIKEGTITSEHRKIETGDITNGSYLIKFGEGQGNDNAARFIIQR
jgi:hypothetical protein